jgi:hypothetical protein
MNGKVTFRRARHPQGGLRFPPQSRLSNGGKHLRHAQGGLRKGPEARGAKDHLRGGVHGCDPTPSINQQRRHGQERYEVRR